MIPSLTMPGESHRGTLPALTEAQAHLSAVLRTDVTRLAGDIGQRNHRFYDELVEAARFIEERLAGPGHDVVRLGYALDGRTYDNLSVEVPGFDRPREIVVVGAHYDSAMGSPGANDNGTGVAAILELAARFATRRPRRTLRLLAFVNEEMPHFANGTMGSQVYAATCHDRGDRVVSMLSLETIGYYRDEPRTQHYPPPLGLLYPSTGNFLGFVGNLRSRGLVRDAVSAFRTHARFPSEGAALPAQVPGVGWSDHASFWERGYPAIMVTDTAPFRYPHYHTPHDTPDKVDYERLARVVDGLDAVVTNLVGGFRR